MTLTRASFSMITGAVANVLDYGASTAAADNTAAIQAAIDAMSAAGGGTVYFPAGTYNLQGTLTIKSNVSYKGDSGTSVLRVNSTPGPTYIFNQASSDVDNVTWDGLTFDGSINYPVNSQVYKATYPNVNNAIRIGGVKATNFLIQNCRFLSLSLGSIDINSPNANNISIVNNYFYKGSYRTNVIMFRAQGATTEAEKPSNLLVQGNHIDICGPQQFYDASKEDYCASCDGIQLDKCRDSVVANNFVRYTASIGIRVEDSIRIVVTGNSVLETGSTGIVVYKDCFDISVTNNVVKNWGRIPPAYAIRNYGGTYVVAREFPDPVAAPLPADPTLSAWFDTWPYTTTGINLSTIIAYSDTNYYVITPNGITPYRGDAAIGVWQNCTRVTVANNIGNGDTSTSGGQYLYGGDFGFSAVPTANNSAAGTVGNNMQNCLVSTNAFSDPRVYTFYSPEYTDPVNVRGPLQPATFMGNRDNTSAIWGGNARISQFGLINGSQLSLTFQAGNTISSGTNTPEGAVAAFVGSLFLRTNGGANTTLYVKESGTGNTGWVAK